jgi:hypothetical protein
MARNRVPDEVGCSTSHQDIREIAFLPGFHFTNEFFRYLFDMPPFIMWRCYCRSRMWLAVNAASHGSVLAMWSQE